MRMMSVTSLNDKKSEITNTADYSNTIHKGGEFVNIVKRHERNPNI